MQQRVGFVWALLASVTWGLSYSFDEHVLQVLSPLWLLVINAVTTLALIVPVLLLNPEAHLSGELIPKHIGFALLTSVLAVLANLFIFLGIKNLGASTAAILEISYPFFVLFFSSLLWKERPTPALLLGGILIFCGAFIIARSRS